MPCHSPRGCPSPGASGEPPAPKLLQLVPGASRPASPSASPTRAAQGSAHRPLPLPQDLPGGHGNRGARASLPSSARQEWGGLLLKLGLNPWHAGWLFPRRRKTRLICHRASSPFIKKKKKEEGKRRRAQGPPKKAAAAGDFLPLPAARAPPPQTARRRGGGRTGRGQSIATVTNYRRKC